MKKLFTLLLIVVTYIVTNAQTNCNPVTITNVEHEGNGNRITWTMPAGGEEKTISQSTDCSYYYYMGLAFGSWNQIKSGGAYHRYTPEHLTTIDGGVLKQVVFVPYYHPEHQQRPGHTHTIQIYQGGTWGEAGARHPGALIASKELDNSDLIFFQENIITLDHQIPIDASQELWIGYYCTDIDTVPDVYKGCAGADNDFNNEGFGNVMFYENKWQTRYEFNESVYNFVIKGIVQTIEGVTVNIYFNGDKIETNIAGITHLHNNPVGEEHCYKVEVNCLEGGVSPFSNEKCIPGVGINDNEQIMKFVVYPNPARNELRIMNYELRIKNVEVFDVFGRLQKAESRRQNEEKEIVVDVSNLASGIYFIRLIDKNGIAVQRFIKE